MFLKPYLIAKGVEPNTVALLVGIYGSLVATFGSLSISFLNKRFTKKYLLHKFTFLNIFSIFLFVLVEYYPLSFGFLIVSVTCIALSMALSSSILFALMMDYTRKEFRAIDYAMQSSIDAIGRILAAIIAGSLIQHFSYQTMFIFEFLGMGFVLAFVYWFFKKYETSTR